MSANQEEGSNTSISSVVDINDAISNGSTRNRKAQSMTRRETNGRELNALKPRVRFVYELLEELYNHPASQEDTAPSPKTPLAKVIDDGLFGAAHSYGSTVPVLELPERLLIAEAAVNHLNDDHKPAVEKWHKLGWSKQSICRFLHISQAVLNNRLRLSHTMIASFCEARGLKVPK